MKQTFLALCFLGIFGILNSQVTIQSDISKPGIKMSQDLVGAFFEDINYGADGGLYAELVQNRSFEYHVVDGYTDEGPLAHWELIKNVGANLSYTVENTQPINPNNPHYLNISINSTGQGSGIRNTGYFGMSVHEGETYKFSVYLKSQVANEAKILVKLVNSIGIVLASDTIASISTNWEKYTLSFTSKQNAENASLQLLFTQPGVFYADMISLFPATTYKNRENGLRKDLAEAIADLHPRFLRFPGGCVSHGRGLENAYRWKETIGDVAERKPNWNLWGYHQTYGIGFYEYFLFCEDMNAKALPVLPVGISCQFRNREIEPISKMGPWIQDALDLIEFANGDTTTTWGKKRSEMGHPAPFNMEYICLGNEEDDIPEFRERFVMFQDTLQKYHPEIKIIGTSGTDDAGGYYNSLWEFSRAQKLDAVDEHYYNSPAWFLENLHRYDNFDRNGPKVFIGEYASQDDRLHNAIAEAAYLTGVERNADVIELTCYAPLLNYVEDIGYHWHPDMILFNNSTVTKTANYYIQQMYGQHAGDEYINSSVNYAPTFQQSSDFSGKMGVGSWNTQVKYDDVQVTVNGENIILEDFASGANNWQVLDGNWSVNSGAYNQSGNATPAWSICNKIVENSDYTLTLKAMKTGGVEGFLIPFAFQDNNNYYWLNIGGWGNTQHAVEKAVNGPKAQLAMLAGSIQNNRWYNIKIEATSQVVKCYLDDQIIFQIAAPEGPVASSITKDYESNELIIKLVNSGSNAMDATVNLDGYEINETADVTVLTGDANARNTIDNPDAVVPVTSTMEVTNQFDIQLPANSFTLIRFKMGTTPISNVEKDENHLLKNLTVCPNPTQGQTQIRYQNNLHNLLSLRMYDIHGSEVLTIENIQNDYVNIDCSRFQQGTYFFSLGDGMQTKSGVINVVK